MSELVDRASAALAWEDGERWEKLVPEERGNYERRVRVVIEAMREPTEAMKNAALTPKIGFEAGQFADVIWRAMIDAALKDS